jgi:hypothetical protein
MFKPGQSGNPGGRKRSKSLGKLMRLRYGHDAATLIDRLEKFSDPQGRRVPKKLQLEATELLLAYHAGRPTQRMDLDIDQPETLRIVVTGEADGPGVARDAEPTLPGA